MAKQSLIKWRPQDYKKLYTYVRKFNAAITRLEKSNPDLIGTGVLPERLDSTELKQRIITRADYNRELRKIDRLFEKDARTIVKDTSGFYTTKWQQRELRYLQQRINAQRRAYVKQFSVPKQQLEFLNLEPIDFKKERKRITEKAAKAAPEDMENIIQEFYNFVYQAERESSADYLTGTFAKLRNAYLKAIDNNLTPEDAETLKQMLVENDIWGSDIVYAISQNDILDFEYYYSLDEKEAKGKLLIDRWEGLMPQIKKARNR